MTVPLQLFINHNYTSPYALSAFVALTEKQLPFSLHAVNLDQAEQYAADYSALSLTQRVPTLVDGDFKLSESSAIDEYLEDRFPAPDYLPLYPADIQQKARARQIQAWLRSDLMPIREERPTTVIFDKPIDTPLSAAAQQAVAKLFAAASTWLNGRDSLFDQWSIADTDLAIMLNRLVINGDPVPAHLKAYAETQWQRPSVQAWLAQSRNG